MPFFRCLPLLVALLFGAAAAQAQMPSAEVLTSPVPSIPAITVTRDWQVLCDSPTTCRAEPRTAPAPEISLTVIRDGGTPVLILRAPLGLLLANGVSVTIDGRAVGQLAFLTCESDGCVAPARLDSRLGRAMRAGQGMTLSLTRRDGSQITGTYSLLGFVAALETLAAQSEAVPPGP